MISGLIIKYLNGDASEAEVSQIFKWIEESEENKKQFIDLKKAWAMSQVSSSDKTEIWSNLIHLINNKQKSRSWHFIKYAAIFILCTTLGFLLWFNKNKDQPITKGIVLEIQDTHTKIELNNKDSNGIGQLQNVIVEQNADEIVYQNVNTGQSLSYHSLNIPYGKTFKVTLADGTVVYLNAGSSLRYPQQFSTDGARKVFLKGEAYFNVKKDPNRPFIVDADDVSVEVLGTQFNVNTFHYLNEFNCVLVEGSVKLSDSKSNVVLTPNQKATKTSKLGAMAVSKVKTNMYTSWVNGELLLENSSFEYISNKLSKFYNIKIDNNNKKLKNQRFSGAIRLQNSDIESILELLRLDTPFSFKKVGNTIIIDSKEP